MRFLLDNMPRSVGQLEIGRGRRPAAFRSRFGDQENRLTLTLPPSTIQGWDLIDFVCRLVGDDLGTVGPSGCAPRLLLPLLSHTGHPCRCGLTLAMK